jgi:hypothetical protein
MKRSGFDQGDPPEFLADGMSRGEIEFLHDEGQIEDTRYDALIQALEEQEALEDVRKRHQRRNR